MDGFGWRLWLWIGGGLGVAIWMIGEFYNRRVAGYVRQAAQLLSLETTRSGSMDGMLGDARVTVRTVNRSGHEGFVFTGTWSRIEVEVPGAIPRRIRLRWRPPGRRPSPGTVATGDALFDSTVELHGDEAELLAVFGAGTRRSVLDLFVGAPFELHDGRLSVLRGGLAERPPLMEIAVRRFVELAAALNIPVDSLPSRLRDTALADPEPGARRRARNVLLQRFMTTPEARDVAEAALEDEDPMVRLHGAMALGEERLEQVENFAQAEALPLEVRLRALEHLVDFAPAEKVMPLASGLFHSADPDVLLALAQVSWRIDHPAVPPLLGRLLVDSANHWELRSATIQALAECGTVEQVEPLLSIADAKLGDAELKKAARTAIARIQSRIEGATAGQLSVAAEGWQAGTLAMFTPSAEQDENEAEELVQGDG